MGEIVRVGAEETSKELLRNTSITISLEGWPCAAAVIGIGIVYALSVKIKCDVQKHILESGKTDNMDIAKVA